MVSRERRTRGANEPEHAPPRPPPPLAALLSGAGNQAVTRMVQRYYENKDWSSTKDAPRTNKGTPKPGWTQNGRPPEDRYLFQLGAQWYVWSQRQKAWDKTTAPKPKVGVPKDKAPSDEPPDLVETEPPPVKVARPPKRDGLPVNAPIQDLEGHSGMALAGSEEEPVALPGGALPDTFVEQVFGHLDTPTLLALRTMNKWLFEHGSSALREYLHKQTPQHPKGRVGGSLSAMSSLGATPLVTQYAAAIKARPPEKLVIASDKANAHTIRTLTEGVPRKALTVHYGERTDKGRDDDRYHPAKGPYDEGTHGGVINSKMHNKLVVGTHTDPETKSEKGDFLLSGSPNLTASAMAANIESAVLIRYPGIAKLYKEYVDRIATRTTDDPEFTEALKSFNEHNVVGIRAALAPFVNISETLNAELKGADEITMRMYLVGSGSKHDTVGMLCNLAANKASVSVVVDQKEADHPGYVRDALKRLRAAKVDVGSEVGKEKDKSRLAKGEDPRGIMHDKVILAHYPKTDAAEERWTVMIGSSGLTRNVDQNWNYENLLIIDDKALFDSMMLHHKAAEAYRTPGVPEITTEHPVGRACKMLEDAVYLPDNKWQWAPVGELIRKLPRGVSRRDLFDAADELGMIVDYYNGRDWFGFK